MGIFSDVKAMADVQRIKSGGTANLSVSQIVTLIINLPDAHKNLSPIEYEKVHNLFNAMRKCKTKMPMGAEGYVDTAVKIIKEFDKIAPYEKYSGGNEIEFSFMMEDIRRERGNDIHDLRQEVKKMEAALKEHDAAYERNKLILAEAYTDEQLLQLVANGEFPAERVNEYLELRRSLTSFVNSAPKIREMHISMIADLKRQLSQFEPIQPVKRSYSAADKLLIVLMIIIAILLVAILIVLCARLIK